MVTTYSIKHSKLVSQKKTKITKEMLHLNSCPLIDIKMYQPAPRQMNGDNVRMDAML